MLVSQALLVTFTLSMPYSFLPCWPKTWLMAEMRTRLADIERSTYRYLDALTKRDILTRSTVLSGGCHRAKESCVGVSAVGLQCRRVRRV